MRVMKALPFCGTALLGVALMFLIADDPPENFRLVNVTISVPQDGARVVVTKEGGLTIMETAKPIPSLVVLENGLTLRAATSDIGTCQAGHPAVGTVRIGRITGHLYELVFVDCWSGAK